MAGIICYPVNEALRKAEQPHKSLIRNTWFVSKGSQAGRRSVRRQETNKTPDDDEKMTD